MVTPPEVEPAAPVEAAPDITPVFVPIVPVSPAYDRRGNSEAQRHLAAKVPVSVKWLGGGVDETYKIDYPDGTAAVFKPSAGSDIPGAAMHEAAARDLAEAARASDLVPVTTLIPSLPSNIAYLPQVDDEGRLIPLTAKDIAAGFGSVQRFGTGTF